MEKILKKQCDFEFVEEKEDSKSIDDLKTTSQQKNAKDKESHS